MNKYERILKELETTNTAQMKVFGNSMLPRIKSGSVLTFKKQDSYEINDVVLSKVRGRWIDAHKIFAKDVSKGYLIGNNRNFQNGWTHNVFAKAVTATFNGETYDL
jgi:hypothetical protein